VSTFFCKKRNSVVLFDYMDIQEICTSSTSLQVCLTIWLNSNYWMCMFCMQVMCMSVGVCPYQQVVWTFFLFQIIFLCLLSGMWMWWWVILDHIGEGNTWEKAGQQARRSLDIWMFSWSGASLPFLNLLTPDYYGR
jgi:hypothetical protein